MSKTPDSPSSLDHLGHFLARAEQLLARVETLLPAPLMAPDWNAAVAFRWRRRNGQGYLQAVPRHHPLRLKDLDAFLSTLPDNFDGIKDTDALAAISGATPAVVIDVRGADEVKANGFIKGSVFLPVNDLLSDMTKLPADKTAAIITVCSLVSQSGMPELLRRLITLARCGAAVVGQSLSLALGNAMQDEVCDENFAGSVHALISHRQRDILQWIYQGKTNWEISRILGVSERTVRFHVEGIFVKLDVSSRTQAVACAMEQGLFADE